MVECLLSQTGAFIHTFIIRGVHNCNFLLMSEVKSYETAP